MNNQFKGPNAWEDYLTALEDATPTIEAIAVTDYYVTETYEEVIRQKAAGRLQNAQLIFPNVEVRLDVATARGGFVNLHLFVSPEDPSHIEELQRLLSRLQFNVMEDWPGSLVLPRQNGSMIAHRASVKTCRVKAALLCLQPSIRTQVIWGS